MRRKESKAKSLSPTIVGVSPFDEREIKRMGFSLIEIVVVVSVMGFILTSITTVLVNSFKAKNRINWADKVEQNGAWVLSEIRKNVINAPGETIELDPADKSWVSLSSIGTTIQCVESADSQIASVSANTVRLSGEEVEVSGCGNFISGTTSPSTGKVVDLSVGFYLSSGLSGGGPSDFVSKYFSSEIKIRN
ncbi:MAG: type II secretion system protein [Candidatus Shapirobacteria bacterium]|jgi:type II secretory pathway pseudopilin PulG